ncbi:MAG: deoxyribodipyrimidine photo-lyase [Cetobacterium sp.]|uniref:deoxyribodipyrimidine photo-lyase n=1 Tax=Cetobacterium TaxID=180162 RepID=UPI001F07068E|nr:deoxyribodipyrimidine photo-lyase [Cetobacterium somerae]MCX3066295.1 deoxyribodipyrimidine photo-lyase [Cetobacterium somerae]UPO96769.1 deoxyribodipyrimidine photo-lyase [Cetobacterium somerae]
MSLFKDSRIKYLKNNKKVEGQHIIYWMQESQRTRYNFALNEAIYLSKKNKIPLYVVFNYLNSYPEASKRHYDFMLQGLKDVKESLDQKGIKFILLEGDPLENIIKVCKKAKVVIWDKSYLKNQREVKERLLKCIDSTILEIESNVVIPVELVSTKEEYSAKTLRDKYRKIETFNEETFNEEKYFFIENLGNVLEELDCSDKYIPKIKKTLDGGFLGGEREAVKILESFIKNDLKFYLNKGPDNERSSKLSPYLHFGQISPVEIKHNIEKLSKELINEKNSFLEEVIIRRELAINFVYYNKNYDNWLGITYEWAYKTLEKHENDKREYIYSEKELEEFKTHDKYWNACQKQMLDMGYMDSYMRMYWCKKILEWSVTPQKAYEIAIKLNNKYFYDGRDPNSYAGVAWCFGKHDRAWKEREIFGKVRYMNSDGLKRKFDIEKYVEKYLK